jgi:hypothetical protein
LVDSGFVVEIQKGENRKWLRNDGLSINELFKIKSLSSQIKSPFTDGKKTTRLREKRTTTAKIKPFMFIRPLLLYSPCGCLLFPGGLK